MLWCRRRSHGRPCDSGGRWIAAPSRGVPEDRGQTTKASVRWRSISPGTRSEDEFFDAAQSPWSSRSTSRVRYTRDGGPKSSPTEDAGQRAVVANPEVGGARDKNAKPVDTGQDGLRRSSPPPSTARPSVSIAPSKWIKPDKFNGSGSVETFLAQFNICGDYNGWSDSDRAAQLVLSRWFCRPAYLG